MGFSGKEVWTVQNCLAPGYVAASQSSLCRCDPLDAFIDKSSFHFSFGFSFFQRVTPPLRVTTAPPPSWFPPPCPCPAALYPACPPPPRPNPAFSALCPVEPSSPRPDSSSPRTAPRAPDPPTAPCPVAAQDSLPSSCRPLPVPPTPNKRK